MNVVGENRGKQHASQEKPQKNQQASGQGEKPSLEVKGDERQTDDDRGVSKPKNELVLGVDRAHGNEALSPFALGEAYEIKGHDQEHRKAQQQDRPFDPGRKRMRFMLLRVFGFVYRFLFGLLFQFACKHLIFIRRMAR